MSACEPDMEIYEAPGGDDSDPASGSQVRWNGNFCLRNVEDPQKGSSRILFSQLVETIVLNRKFSLFFFSGQRDIERDIQTNRNSRERP